jgi:hypothetical protein
MDSLNEKRKPVLIGVSIIGVFVVAILFIIFVIKPIVDYRNRVKNAIIAHAASAASHKQQQALLAGQTNKQALDAAAAAAAAAAASATKIAEDREKQAEITRLRFAATNAAIAGSNDNYLLNQARDNHNKKEAIRKRSADHKAEHDADVRLIMADDLIIGDKSTPFYSAHRAMMSNNTPATRDAFSAVKISLFTHINESVNMRKNMMDKHAGRANDAKNVLNEANYELEQKRIAANAANTTTAIKDEADMALSVKNEASVAYDKSATYAKGFLDNYTYTHRSMKAIYDAYETRIPYPGYTFHRHIRFPQKNYIDDYIFDTQSMAAKIKQCDETATCDAIHTEGPYASTPEHNLSDWSYGDWLNVDSGTYVKNTYRDKLMPESTRSVSSDYTFYHNYYIPDNNIGKGDPTNMINMLTTCSANPLCAGIDSRGDIVGRAPPQRTWTRGPDNALSDAGTYVKNQYAQLIV